MLTPETLTQSNIGSLFFFFMLRAKVALTAESESATPVGSFFLFLFFSFHKLATGWKNKLKFYFQFKAFLCSHKGLNETPVELLQD